MPGTGLYAKKFVEVLGRRLAYHEAGSGDPVIFLHGNPTSSYLWRNVIPYVEDVARCVAPDLIGMGDSEKLPEDLGPERYRFTEHARFLDAFYETIGVSDNVILVCVDWGSALAFDWANRHRGSVQGIVYMEAIVRPRTWDDYTARRPTGGGREAIQRLRSQEGEQLVLEQNLFVEKVLPSMVMRTMSDDELAEYRRPYLEPGENRRAMRAWPQELPINGEPADNVAAIQAYADWLSESDVPKLFINGDPGMSLVDAQREFCRSWPNQHEITVSGHHNLPEDSPVEIGMAVAQFVKDVRGAKY